MELLGTDLKPGFETPGLKLFREHQFQQALKHFNEEFRQTRDREHKQLLKYYMGVSAYYLGDYAKAKRYFLSVSKVDGDRVARELRYRSIANLAVVEVAQGNYEKGARIYEKFLPLFEKSDFPLDRCQLYCNTGHNYTLLKRYDEAREFLDRAEEVAAQTEMLAKKMLVLYYRGHLELRLENYNVSIRLLKKALNCAEETKDGFWRARINWLLGNAYLRKNSLEQSLTYLKRAIRLGKKHSHRMVVARCLNDYAWALYLKGNYTEAKSYAEEALIIQRDLGLQVKNFYDTLDHINQELNSYQEEEAVFNEIERESAREFGIIGISDGITAVIDRI
jgi:tetratricopeptide (TPR) repeat protein